MESYPTEGGFDYWNILVGQGEYYQPEFVENGEHRQYNNTHVTYKITDLVLDFLEDAPEEKPWMMMMHHKAPHRNQAPPLEFLGHFGDKNWTLPETFFDDYSTRCPAAAAADNKIKNQYWSNDLKLDIGNMTDPGTGGGAAIGFDAKKAYDGFLNRLNEEQRKKWLDYYEPLSKAFYEANYTGQALEIDIYNRFMRDYMQSIAAVDESVGKVLNYLEEKGELDNTLVIYTSDQGFFLGEHGFFDKRFMYEPTLHTPLLMRYPKMIEAGSVTDKMVLNLDYGATFLEFTGIEKPEEVQGESLLPVMTGKADDEWRKSIYYHYYEYPGWHSVRKQYGVRTETHKLIKFYGDDIVDSEMFDLVNDPNELVNLAGMPQYADLQASLESELHALQVKYKDTTFNETIATPAYIYPESYRE